MKIFLQEKKKENWSKDLMANTTNKCMKCHLVFPNLKKVFVSVLFCFVLFFPLAETEANPKGEWSKASGGHSKVYPHSGRGRVEWSLAIGCFEKGRLPSHWLNPCKCASPQLPPPLPDTCQSHLWSISEGEWLFLKSTRIPCPGDSDWKGLLKGQWQEGKVVRPF